MVFEQEIQLMFAARRAQLLSKFDENAVLIIVGNKQKTRSKNIKYHFRPDNDLYYVTGFTEPDAVAVFRPNHSSPFVLFNRAKDPAAETNFGERAGQVGAVEKFAANLAFDIETIDVELPQLLEDRCDIYYLDEQDIYKRLKFYQFKHICEIYLGYKAESIKTAIKALDIAIENYGDNDPRILPFLYQLID